PPFWKVAPAPAGEAAAAFNLTAPARTLVRDAPVRVLLQRGGKKVGELAFLLPVRGVLDAKLLPMPGKGGKGGAALIVANNSDTPQQITWRMALAGEAPIQSGKFNLQAMEPAKAYFAEAAEGTRTVGPREQVRIEVPLAGVDPLAVYRVKAVVVDPEGRIVEIARYVGGFLAAPRADKAIQLDGRLDEDAWGKCPVAELNDARQARALRSTAVWKGPEDLSAKLRFLWDDKGLYVAMEVTDDVLANPKEGESMWNQDGLQFLIDPFRAATDKGGKYDYSLGLGQKGPQAWCHLAPAGVSSGEAKDVVVAARPTGKAGGMVYEVFFPWARLAPFSPAVGANLGIAAILNEDDGPGRASFMTWFGDIQTKEVDAVGDVILAE
ncbi:MAG TPA: sugar-binding protein, partial [Phycisphaerae bacterium]|nr:sugar-binding protein [Phycisphaerae bacterium]